MTETYINTTMPSKYAWSKIQHSLVDGGKKTTPMPERDILYQMFDREGDIHVCQEMLNKFVRCRRANPASFDASLVCRKFHEDYLECFYAEKKNIRDRTGQDLWRKYEYAKANNPDQIQKKLTKFTPIYSD